MRIRLPLWVLLLASCSEPPPPPPPPPTPAQRLDKGVEKLRRLAEEQLAASPGDARLRLWVGAFKGEERLDPSASGPLPAVLRASRPSADEAAMKAVEAALPGSSTASLFRARGILRNARKEPGYWKAAAEAVEEALKRKRWDGPVRDFRAWALEWLETHEPDPLVRACFRFPFADQARLAAPELLAVAEGMAGAIGAPRLDAPRVARAVRLLIEERLLKSPDAADFLLGHDLHPRALEAQFLLAWRAKDLETARSASLALEDYGRRDAALTAYKPALSARFGLEATIEALFKDGALKPPFPLGVAATPGDDASWRAEALKELDAGAKAYVAALKAAAVRAAPFAADFESKRPERSRYVNYLGQALRDRDFLYTDAYPKDRHAQLLDAAFLELKEPGAVGATAYAWTVLENLPRAATIPSKDLARRFSKDQDAPDVGRDMDVFALLLARKEEVGADRRPSPAAVRERDGSLFGYLLLLRDAVKAKSAAAVEWLPEPKEAAPSRVEVSIAETLRAATEKDFGPDWARWKAFLTP